MADRTVRRHEKDSAHWTIPVKARLFSPLRYPGSKRRQADYIAQCLVHNDLTPRLLVEPFAGGANVSLRLLAGEYVEEIGLGESDPWVASFWKTVFWDSEWLINQVEKAEISVEEWNRMKRYRPRSRRNQAFAALFLNRTSYSGILAAHAGPIGGQKQASEYDVACRFPKNTLVRRIEDLASHADSVRFIRTGDWRETIARGQRTGFGKTGTFYYLDPPFYAKASRLYRCAFTKKDHRDLYQFLKGFDRNWILSYDDAEAIHDLYTANGLAPRTIRLSYTAAARTNNVASPELIFSNLPALPAEPSLR